MPDKNDDGLPPEREEVTTHLDGYHRHGDPDPSTWEKAEAVTDRPNDTPLRGDDEWAVPNSTLASRAKAAKKAATKQVSKDADEVEDKKVTRASTKSKK